jgi:hypothetical protein
VTLPVAALLNPLWTTLPLDGTLLGKQPTKKTTQKQHLRRLSSTPKISDDDKPRTTNADIKSIKMLFCGIVYHFKEKKIALRGLCLIVYVLFTFLRLRSGAERLR